MTLRVKNSLIIGSIFFILFILGYVIPSGIILNEYLKSENRFINSNIERFNLLFFQEIENLDKIVSDWAYWDDTYNFVQTNNKNYIKSNLVDETFENLRINYVLFFNKEYNLVFKKFYDLILNEEENFPENLYEKISEILKKSDVENLSGIISIDSQVFILSIKKITTSDLASPYNGYLSMGYLLTPERLWELSKILGYPVVLFSYNYKYLPEDFKTALEKLKNINIYINPINKSNIYAYFTLKDIFENECSIIRVEFQRDIYSQGIMTLNYFLVIFLTLGLVLFIVFIIILRRTVLNPLTDTLKKMKIIADNLDFNQRLEVKGEDEISNFSKSFNKIIENFKIYEDKLKQSEEKYRSLFENAVEGIFQSTPDGKVINANRSFIKMLGYDSFEEIKNLDVKRDIYFNPDDRDEFLNEINKKGIFNNIELTLKKKDGTKIIVLENSRAVNDEKGNILFYEGMFTDITELKKYEEKLSFRVKLERLINEIALEFISTNYENLNNEIIKNLEKLREMLFFDRIYILILSNDNKIDDFYECDKNGIERIKEKINNFKLNSNIKYENMIVINKDNNKELIHPLFDYSIESLILIPLIYGSSLKGFIGFENLGEEKIEYDDFIKLFLRIFSDIIINTIERIKNENNLKFISFHDSLTGLYNRFYFEEELDRLSKSREVSLSIIICDIDNLKFINDSFGHETGDIAIIEVAKILKSIFRDEDIIARIGGDEFVILLQNIDENVIKDIINRIYEEMANYSSKVGSLPISVSTGYSILKEKNKDPFMSFEEADDMMYNVKILKKDLSKDYFIDKLKSDLVSKGYIDDLLIKKMEEIAINFSDYLKLPYEKRENLINLIEYHDIGIIKIYGNVPAIKKEDISYDYLRHTHIGYRIAINSKKLSKIADLILKHHEEFNGQGFPLHLKGDEIPLECRIFSIIYSYCKNGNLDEIKLDKGIKFDPEIVDEFIYFINQYKN